MNASKRLTRAEADAFGRELDALRNEVRADLGQRDVERGELRGRRVTRETARDGKCIAGIIAAAGA